MASEWYVEDNERATGPFTVAQMKAQVTSARIKPDTRVRKGRRGKWVEAKNVKGLIPANENKQSPARQRTAATKDAKAVPRVTGEISGTEGVFLAPLRNRKRRGIVFILLVLFIVIGQAPIHQQLFFDITVGLLIGSYPLVEVKKKTIEQTLIIFFIPVHRKVWKMRDFVGVETGVEPRIADTLGCFVLIFFWYWFLFRLFDHIVPWLGGNYKLFLRQYDDEKLLIWQGNNTTDFENNLALFESAGLPIG